MPQIRDDLYARAFSVMLRVERRRRGWSIEEMSRRCNVTRSGVSAWELGACSPTYGNIIKIANVFGVKLSDMMRSVENVASILDRHNDQATEPADSSDHAQG